MEVKELRKELRKLYDKHSKLANSIDCSKVSYEEYCDLLQPTANEISDIEHQLRVLEDVEWKDIPKYGDLMTFEDWKECVEGGGFIDYDGHGYYSDGKRETNKMVVPSDVKKGRLLTNPEFTHVVWYNR